MKTLRSMSISRRLWLILVVAVAMLVVLGLLMLRQIHGDLYQAKAEKTRHVVQTAAGVLAYYQGLEAAGTLSREAAQQQALQWCGRCATTTTTTSGSTTWGPG